MSRCHSPAGSRWRGPRIRQRTRQPRGGQFPGTASLALVRPRQGRNRGHIPLSRISLVLHRRAGAGTLANPTTGPGRPPNCGRDVVLAFSPTPPSACFPSIRTGCCGHEVGPFRGLPPVETIPCVRKGPWRGGRWFTRPRGPFRGLRGLERRVRFDEKRFRTAGTVGLAVHGA